MKAIRIVVGVVVLLALLVTGLQTAQAGTGKFVYTTGFQVQNIDLANAASVNINFYDLQGNSQASWNLSNISIAAGGSQTFFPLTTLPGGFQGSVVVSSSTKVASVVNILGSGAAPAASAYVGASLGSSTLYVPLLMKGNSGNDTWLSVQNTGGSATDITVTYSDGTVSKATAVQPSASAIFYQTDETHPGKVFSGVITSTGSTGLAAIVLQETTSVMYAYSAFGSQGDPNLVFPLVNSNNSGIATGIQVQNNGSSDTVVTLSYVHSLFGTDCTETQTVTAGKSSTFALFAFGGNPIPNGGSTTCTGGQRFVGSARVTGNTTSQPLAGVVNQLHAPNYADAYDAFAPSAAAQTVVLPLIQDRNGTGHTAYTGFSVMNVGSQANVSCTFTNTTYTVPSTPLAQYGSLIDIQGGKIKDRYVGSATCTATSGGLLVVVVNEYADSTGDNFMVYTGIPAQ